MKKNTVAYKLLRGLYSYFLFFLLVAFLVTCTTSLFVTILADSIGVELTDKNVQTAAKITFVNVVCLSILFTAIDAIRRKLTTERITKRITFAARKMVNGDFSVRIAPVNELGADENYNEIIDCFNTMASELSSVETLRTDFVANVSHEMKTPLAVMKNYATLLQSEELDKERRVEYAKAIGDASRRLSDMMTNILKLNRLENQQIYPKSEEYDLSEQLCECLLQYESTWEEKSIAIETDIEENVIISADSELLSLVWSNLFSNAFKFTPNEGMVSIRLSTDDAFAYVSVSDTGCGISTEAGAHIFEKFYQGDTSHAVAGNGLGLALVKRVVDIVDGEISVQSTIGEGSTFTVKIRKNEQK